MSHKRRYNGFSLRPELNTPALEVTDNLQNDSDEESAGKVPPPEENPKPFVNLERCSQCGEQRPRANGAKYNGQWWCGPCAADPEDWPSYEAYEAYCAEQGATPKPRTLKPRPEYDPSADLSATLAEHQHNASCYEYHGDPEPLLVCGYGTAIEQAKAFEKLAPKEPTGGFPQSEGRLCSICRRPYPDDVNHTCTIGGEVHGFAGSSNELRPDWGTKDQETPDVDPNEQADAVRWPWTTQPDQPGTLRELASQARVPNAFQEAPGLWNSQKELDQFTKIGVERNDLRDEATKLKADLQEAQQGRRDAEAVLAKTDADFQSTIAPELDRLRQEVNDLNVLLKISRGSQEGLWQALELSTKGFASVPGGQKGQGLLVIGEHQVTEWRASLVVARVRLEKVLEGDNLTLQVGAQLCEEARTEIKKVLASLPVKQEGM